MSLTRFRRRAVACAFLFGLATSTAYAAGSSEIDWGQLVPPQSPALTKEIQKLQGALADLTDERQELYYQIDDQASLRQRIDAGFIDETQLADRDKAILVADYRQQNPEIAALWDQVQKANLAYESEAEKTNAALNGKSVRIPGYILPLESEGNALREFLLVPFVGACIHVPPPPANQMVFVKVDQPYESDGLYEPVWIEGVLQTGKGSHDLSLVDGESEVTTGYSMQAVKVSKYTR